MLQGRKEKFGGDTEDRLRDEPQGMCLARCKGLFAIGELLILCLARCKGLFAIGELLICHSWKWQTVLLLRTD